MRNDEDNEIHPSSGQSSAQLAAWGALAGTKNDRNEEVRALLAAGETQREVARIFGISQHNVWLILHPDKARVCNRRRNARPETKTRANARKRMPKNRARIRTWEAQPEVRARRKAYRARPEVKARKAATDKMRRARRKAEREAAKVAAQ